MAEMNSNTTSIYISTQESYTIAKGIDGILWIWEKIEDNVWKVYAYEAPHKFHFEDDKGNRIVK